MTLKLEKVSLLLLFLLLPSQLAYHFWPPWSLIHGIRVDYLSPTLFLTDILIFLLFLVSKFRIRVPIYIILFVVLNISISISPLNSIYRWFRILEYFWLLKYLILRFDWLLRLGIWSLSASVIWTSLLAWTQFLLQRSVGGLLYWLGERSFNIGTPGIAKISLAGHLLLRPYATLPHPNALAGFLLVAALLLFCHSERSRGIPFLSKMAITIAALTIPISFSRTAIILEAVIIGYFLIRNLKNITLKFLLVIFTFAFCLLNFSYGSPDSIPNRQALNIKAISAIKQNWLFGVGLGNFIPASSKLTIQQFNNITILTQPVHNIYLLLTSELGLPAFFALSFIVIKSLSHLSSKNKFLLFPLIAILISGLVDHYWITLHQNTLLLVIFLSLIKLQSITTNDHK